MRRVVIEPDAQLELRAAAQWYSEQEPGLGDELILEIDRTIEGLVEGAHRHPIWRTGRPYRKVRPHRFHDGELVHVFAVAHRGRKPGYWLNRTR